jgi:hypothetical protein
MYDKNVGFEEIHIIKREDGKGFNLNARGVLYGEPCTIDIPNMQQPNISINKEYSNEYLWGGILKNKSTVSLEFQSVIKPENEKYYTVTIDSEYYFQKQIKKLENEIAEIKIKAEESIRAVFDKIEELKR